MGLISRSIRRLLPQRGRAWWLPSPFGDVVDALALSFERLRTQARTVLTESLPGTAVDTLPRWYAALGIQYDATQSLADRQSRIGGAYGQLGGQDPVYLQAQVTKELPTVSVQERRYATAPADYSAGLGRVGLGVSGRTACDQSTFGAPSETYYYDVTGTVQTRTQYNMLLVIIARIMPAHLSPVIVVIIENEDGVARVGLGMLGNARIGKEA